MAIRSACIFFLFLFCLKCFAQTDSLYTDTVIIVQPPLVIKKQVHVSVPEYIREVSSIELGTYYSVDWNLSPSSFTTNGTFHSMGIQARYNLGNFQAGVGVGIMQTKATYRQETVASYQTFRTDTILQELECYFQIMNGQLVKICEYDTVASQTTTTHFSSTQVQHNSQVGYVQVPLSFAYHFRLSNWSLSPGLQAIYHKRTSSSDDFWNWKENMWMMGTEIRLGYLFHSHLLTEVKVEYKKNLTPLNDNDEHRQNWNLLGLGIGIYYRF